jgi:uncharacterized damage-inducible protein DinB
LLGDIRLLARYNAWMNARLYDGAAKLSPAALAQERGAFFGSLLGTLNHLVVGDTIWLQRFATHPSASRALEPMREIPRPTSLDEVVFTDLATLRGRREQLDSVISRWAAELTEADLDHVLEYTNMKGVVSRKPLHALLLHFFNHQTHHRGQATTLLSQAGVDVGVTDLLALIPDVEA